MLSSFNLTIETFIAPLFSFYLDLGLQCAKQYRFVQYTPREVFNRFAQSIDEARRAGDENPLSGVVGGTKKLQRTNCYRYEIMDRSKHTLKNFLVTKRPIKLLITGSLRDSIL